MFVATFFLVLFLPLFTLVMALVVLIDGRPIIYSQTRVGKEMKLFAIYKFRTMTVGAHSVRDGLQVALFTRVTKPTNIAKQVLMNYCNFSICSRVMFLCWAPSLLT